MKTEKTIDKHPFQDADAKLNALMMAAVDAIIIIDQSGNIESFNAAAETMFCYHASDVIGKNVNILMPEPYQSQHDQYLHNYALSKQAKIIGIGREVQGLKSNGEVFPIELSVGEVKESSDKLFIGIIRDITDRVEAQNDVRESRERLSHVTRLTTMGEMAAGIAHEINQPLTAIATYAQACRRLLEQNFNSKDQLSQTLDKISAQALRAGEVIRRLRTFVKKRSGQREIADINILINEVVNMAHADTRLLAHGVNIKLAEDLPSIVVDTVQIQQVLLNLIRNAIDAMEEHSAGPVSIESRQCNNAFIEVLVSDTGCGVTADAAKYLFNPFFTTKINGMGMGLPISQSIVNAHGGRLQFNSNKPSGSLFSFTLPIMPKSTQTPNSE